MKKIVFLISLMPLSMASFAQEASTTSVQGDLFKDPMLPFYIVTGFVFVVALLVVVVAVYMIKVLNIFINEAAAERAVKLGIPRVKELGMWAKFWNRINAFKPIEKEADLLLDHNFDGIRELDNHLPPWWTWLFYATIVWGAVYMVVYHISDSLPLQEEEYQQELTVAQEQKQKLLASQPALMIDENTLVFENNPEIIQNGRKVYVTNCASCHNPEGQGSVGPNLTDEFWLHGGSIKNIYTIVKNGVQEKGMIPWGPVLSPQQIRDVSFYIMSIRGTNPPNPKAPQGTLWKDEAVPVADSVKAQASL